MTGFTRELGAAESSRSDESAELLRLSERLPPLLSIIAGSVDLIGFFTLGNIFTAHITGNLVLASATVVHGHVNLTQALAIPVFMLAVAATWLVSRASNRRGAALARLLLGGQFVLLAAVLIFSVLMRPSANPHGLVAGIAAMIAVSAMGCQYALLRLSLPKVVSTAVMTGNLTNAVLALIDLLAGPRALMEIDSERLGSALRLLAGFLIGCLMAAVAVFFLADWAWSLPLVLSALAFAL